MAAQTPFVKEKRGYVWLMGYDNNPDDLTFGGTRIDFNFSPPALSYEYRDLNFDVTNASICDAEGNLLFYTNGIEAHNAQGQQIENGGGLNPDPYTEFWRDRGYLLPQGVLFLPIPGQPNRYHLLHGELTTYPEGLNGGYLIGNKLYLSEVYFEDENNNSLLVRKNTILVSDTLEMGKITAVRHANGLDWWALQQEYFSNSYYTLMTLKDSVQVLGTQSAGQAVFSPDGSKYVHFTTHNIEEGQFVSIYNFGRCTGQLYDPIQITYNDTAFSGGVPISPNSRFLYVSSYRFIYQYDLEAEDIEASREVYVFELALPDGGRFVEKVVVVR